MDGYLNILPALLPYSADQLVSPGTPTTCPNVMNTSLLSIKPRCIAIGLKITPLVSQAENQGAMRVLIDHSGSVILSSDPESIIGTRVYPLNANKEVNIPIMFEHRKRRGTIILPSDGGGQYIPNAVWGCEELYPTAEAFVRHYTDAEHGMISAWAPTNIGGVGNITIPNYGANGVLDTGTPGLRIPIPTPVASVTFKGTSTSVAVSYRVEAVIHMSYDTRSQISLPLVQGSIIDPQVRSALDHILDSEERESGKTWAERAHSAWDRINAALDSDTAWYVRRLIAMSMEDTAYPRLTGGWS
jgi:hypothetical protein